MDWIEIAINDRFAGQNDFAALSVKSGILLRMGKEDEAISTIEKAVALPDARVGQIHQYGRQLITAGKPDAALRVFKMNAERFPETWPVNVGLARGYSAVGEYQKALKYAKLAQKNVPEGDQLNKGSVEDMIAKLGRNEDIN
ncbi:MAG: hypothetical protein R3B47_04500 [Bacteroidia bacterium]